MCYDKRHNGYKRLKLFDIKPHKGVAAVSEKNTKLYDGISEFALYLFGEGTNHQAYDMLGAHPYKKDGAEAIASQFGRRTRRASASPGRSTTGTFC